jgi:hypothetical protein
MAVLVGELLIFAEQWLGQDFAQTFLQDFPAGERNGNRRATKRDARAILM